MDQPAPGAPDSYARAEPRHGETVALFVPAGRPPHKRGHTMDEFRGWHEPDSSLSLATLAVAGRPGAGRPATLAWARRTRRVAWIGNPAIDISSSLVRERVRGGHSCRYLVPDPVWRYIERDRL